MTAPRTYGDCCGVARALDVVGERWALLVVRELVLGPKRFTDLRAGLPGASANVLAQRLRELEQAGIVAKRRLPPPAASQVYELTPRGAELEPVVFAIGRWGAATPLAPEHVGMSLDSHLLALRTLFAADRADGLEAVVELRLDEEVFTLAIADGQVRVVRGGADGADVMLDTTPGTLLALLHGGRELDDALAAHDARFAGDEALLRRFLELFPLPLEHSAPG
jgi:DNA-binding HxlR family transcriptional regulator/putative sterol carrier protein